MHALFTVQRMPDWFPGTGYRKAAEEGAIVAHKMQHLPYDVTKAKYVRF